MRTTLARGAAIGTLIAAVSLVGWLELPELQALNILFELRGARRPVTPIVIVTIDEDSFDELNQAWPWPRALHGRFLDIVSRAQPIAIGLDIVFAEPSARGPADDQALAEAITRAGNVVLAAAQTVIKDQLFVKVDYNPPIPLLRRGAAGFGVVNDELDADANVRRAKLEYPLGGDRLHSFVWQLYQMGARAGIAAEPLPPSESFMINYRGGVGTFQRIPYYRVLNGEVGPADFAGKIVLVGATTPVLHDVFSTPFAPSNGMPGVEIHAHTLETLFLGIPLHRVPRPAGLTLVFLPALLAVWLTRALRPLRAFFVLAQRR